MRRRKRFKTKSETRFALAACEALEIRRMLSTVYVDHFARGPTHDGTSWATAFTDLQPVVQAAVSGTTIEVAEGKYYPTIGTDRTATFQLNSGVEIDGGFAGAANPTAARNVAAYPTILSGDVGTPADNSDNSYHVVTGSGTDGSAIMDGFTITGGNAESLLSSQTVFGRGFIISSGSPTIRNCAIGANTAYDGGDVYDYQSSPEFTNCMISGDSAVSDGGGIANFSGSSPVIVNCSFTGNFGASFGGGVADEDNSSPAISNCSFIGDRAGSAGGGVYNANSSNPTIIGCVFANDSAGGGAGGGVLSTFCGTSGSDGKQDISDCIFINDSAMYGGGVYSIQSTLEITNCSFFGNSASISGGRLRIITFRFQCRTAFCGEIMLRKWGTRSTATS